MRGLWRQPCHAFKLALFIVLISIPLVSSTQTQMMLSSRDLYEVAKTNTSKHTTKPTATTHLNASSTPISQKKEVLTNITSIDRTQIQARIPTYRNGYGTNFKCTSACYFGTAAYFILIAGLIAVMSVIPVQSPSHREQAPFLLWFGDKEPDISTDLEQDRPRRVVGTLGRLVAFCFGSVLVTDYYDAVPKKIIEVEPDNQEEVKTYESVAVETDDSLLPPLNIQPPTCPSGNVEECVVIDDIDSLFTHVPPVRSPGGSKKPGIFSPVLSRRGSNLSDLGNKSESNLVGPEGNDGSTSPHRKRSGVSSPNRKSGKRKSANGEEQKDDLVAAIEKRQSMFKRAEKRKEYLKADIDHQKLDEREVQMYEYLEFVRELLEGVVIKKICQSAHKVVKRTFFITPDLQTIFWNKMGNKTWNVKKSSIESCWIENVVKGNPTGKENKQQVYLTIILKKESSGRKQLELEAKDEAQCKRLFIGFTRLGMERKQEKIQQEETTNETVPTKIPGLAPVSRKRSAATSQEALAPSKHPGGDQDEKNKHEEKDHDVSENEGQDEDEDQETQE